MYEHPKIQRHRALAFTAFAIATALSMSSSAFAADAPATATPASQQKTPCTAADREPVAGSHIRKDCYATNLEKVVVFAGADLGPGDTQWTDDDTSAPALPMTRASTGR